MNISIDMVKDLDFHLDIDRLFSEIDELIKNPLVKKLGGFSFQSRENIDGIASYFESFFDLSDGKFFIDGKLKESEFCIINKRFKDSYISEIIDTYSLTRTRLVIMAPRCCLSFHADPTPRFHIPIKTNSDCYFYFPDKSNHYHLKEGKAYAVNTKQTHNFMNTSKEERIHILGNLPKDFM